MNVNLDYREKNLVFRINLLVCKISSNSPNFQEAASHEVAAAKTELVHVQQELTGVLYSFWAEK